MSFRLDVSFFPACEHEKSVEKVVQQMSHSPRCDLVKVGQISRYRSLYLCKIFFFFICVASPSTASSSADFLLADIGPHVNTLTYLHKMTSLETIRVYYHQCHSAFLNWKKIKCNLDKALTWPRREKNVGTKAGSVIPGSKSVIRILKLKSRTITEIP